MKDNSVSKNRVVSTILFIFSVMFIAYIVFYYQNSKKDMDFFKQNTQKSIGSLYREISHSMFEKQLKHKSELMLEQFKSQAKKEAMRDRDKTALQKLFQMHYDNLKIQIRDFKIMHFYDKDGISILRMHDPDRYGDDLKSFRACVRSVIKSRQKSSFYELGIHGLAYRLIAPIYDKDELLGFLELGIRPTMLLEKVQKIFGLKGYVFIENKFKPKGIKGNIVEISDKYSICKMGSQEDKFIDKIKSINIDNQKNFKISQRSYNIIKKDIYDAQHDKIGSIVFFQDITEITNRIDSFIAKSILLFFIALLLTYIALDRYIERIFKKLSRARFLLDNTTDAIYVVALKDGSIMDVNKRASLMLGFSRRELLQKKVIDFRTPMSEDEVFDWQEHVSLLRHKHLMISRGIHTRKDGTTFPVESSLSYIKDENEEYMIAVVRDITQTLKLEKKIQIESNEIKQLQDVISKSVLYTTSDLNGKITSVSKAFEEFSGYKATEIIGKNHSIFKHPKTPKRFYNTMWEKLLNNETFVGEVENYGKDGKEQWVKLTINPIFDEEGVKVGYSSYRENITDKKELEYISTHDTLTGIHNREYFQQELHKKISSATRYNQSFGFVMLDVDHFKSINDTYGHAAGDKVLKNLPRARATHMRQDDTFARWGGEEFIVIANGATIDSLKGLIKKLQNEIANTLFNPAPKITVSFGLTLFKKGDSIKTIQERADDALYQAKKNGRDRYEIIV